MKMPKIYSFTEHSLSVSGEKVTLLELVEFYERTVKEIGSKLPNTWSDLIFKIKRELDEEFCKEVDGGADDE